MVNAMRTAIHTQTQNYGRIINTISRNAEYDSIGTSAYSAAKAGCGPPQGCCSRAERYKYLVNMLIPGPTRTAIWGKDMPQFQEPSATCNHEDASFSCG